jgi:hypothetical protein
MDDGVRVARPRVQRLSVEMEREAIRLLAGLLADAAKPGVVMPGAFQREKRGPMPGARSAAKVPASPRGSAKRRAPRSATKVGE